MDDDLLKGFIVECREHLADIEGDLLRIEEMGANLDEALVNKVFRAAHSIKGGSAFFGLNKVKELSHKAETVLDMLRSRKMTPNAEVTNILLAAFDQLREMINHAEQSEQADISENVVSLTGLASSYLPQDQKSSLTAQVTLKPAAGRGQITLPQTDVDRARRTGLFIYWADCDLIHDIEAHGQDILALFKRLSSAGEILDCTVDTEAIGTLDDALGNRVPLRLVVATVLEPDMVEGLFAPIPRDRVKLLMDPHADRPLTALPPMASTPPRKEPAPREEPVAREEPPAPEPAPLVVAAPVAPAAVAPAAPRSPRPAEGGAPATEAADETLRVNVGLLETLMNLAGELVLSRNQLRAAVAQNNHLLLNTANQRVNQVTSELQDVIMQTRLQPVGNVFLKFPRMVRDLSRSLNKEVQLEIQGKEVALDKTLIEGLSDPLTHMVRNAVDHGVETTAERVAAGKSPAGLVRIEARHEAGQVVIEISDDGKGIDPEKITEAAVRKGLLTAEKAATLSERDRQALIFLPGLSTAKVLSDVSGRGVGMDVVKTNLDRLGGQVEIHSVVGRGSTFRIKLPLTLAIIPSLIVTLRDERFAIPQANIEELLRLQPAEVAERIEIVGDTEVLLLRDRVLPLVRLEQVLGTGEPAAGQGAAVPQALEIAVVTTGITSFGLVVGAYHDTEEVVVKPLGRRFQRLREYAGATILGDGALALILDTAGIAAKRSLTAAAEETRGADRGAAQRQQDQQMLLLFHNGPEEPCALPLDLVQRIERIEPKQVERLGHQRTMQYRGSSLPLVTLGDAAQVGALDESRDLVVLVTHEHGRDVGLLCNMPVDVVETAAALDRSTHRQRGIAGSVILRERTTLVADLHEVIGAVHPEWAAEATPAPAASSAPRLAAAPGGGMTVLLAEDSDFFRAQVKRYLEEDGMQVLAAPDGEAAWNLLLQNLDAVRAVVTDIEMPQLNGLQLAHRIRVDQRTAQLPVIAVSSLAGEEDIARGKAAGVSEYQFKLDREKLLASVHAYLGR